MKKLIRFELWLTLLLIVAFIVLSIVGAFLGADKAKQFFNSPPLIVFWIIFTASLTVGLLTIPRLRNSGPLLLIHAGCILVLIGAMWGSAAGHQWQKQFLNIDKIPTGYMRIHEGQLSNQIIDNFQKPLHQLPFQIYLSDFRLDYYWEYGKLHIQTQSGRNEQMPAQLGQQLNLGPDLPTIKITSVFKNFKVDITKDPHIYYDKPDSGTNPALQLQLTQPDGTTSTRYVFERVPSRDFDKYGLRLFYTLMPRDYFSDLTVLENDQPVLKKTIEVNKPLYYGGYYFYQSDFDHIHGHYTILSVTSDTGQPLVFGGFLLLIVGLFWHFWLNRMSKFFKS